MAAGMWKCSECGAKDAEISRLLTELRRLCYLVRMMETIDASTFSDCPYCGAELIVDEPHSPDCLWIEANRLLDDVEADDE